MWGVRLFRDMLTTWCDFSGRGSSRGRGEGGGREGDGGILNEWENYN